MTDRCSMPGCAGELSAARVVCVETTSRQCGRCGASVCRRDDCAHEAELARLREALRVAQAACADLAFALTVRDAGRHARAHFAAEIDAWTRALAAAEGIAAGVVTVDARGV